MIVAALAQDLLVAGLSRAAGLSYNKLLRMRKIEAVLRGQSAVNPAVQAALSDFSTLVIAHYKEWQEPLKLFLRDPEGSGLITLMAEQALTGVSLPESKKAFLDLYANIFTETGAPNAEELYEKLTVAFSTSLQSLALDPAIAFLLSGMQKTIERRLAMIEVSLSSKTFSESPFSDYSMLAEFLVRMTRTISVQFRNVRIETNKGAKWVDLSRIFIPSKIQCRGYGQLVERLEAAQILATTKKPRQDESISDASGKVLTYQELQASLQRAVVLGDPGGGKSTLCQYMCYTMSKQFILAEQYPDTIQKHTLLQSARIPVRIILRNFETAGSREPQLGIFDYVVRDV